MHLCTYADTLKVAIDEDIGDTSKVKLKGYAPLCNILGPDVLNDFADFVRLAKKPISWTTRPQYNVHPII